jgi:hypothetical protein
MPRRLLRGIAIGMAVIVAIVAIPSSAYAVGDGSSTRWQNYSNNRCMGVAGGNSAVQDGAAIITWTCNGSADQTWVLSLVDPNQPNGPYFIKNSVATSECLSVAAKSPSAGARLVLWHCKAASDNQDQRWYLFGDRQSPYLYLSNYNSGLVATALNTGKRCAGGSGTAERHLVPLGRLATRVTVAAPPL